MKRILLTGGSGFVGNNLKGVLKQWYEVDAPVRKELDLKSSTCAQVSAYIEAGKYDFIIHSANPNPVKNSLDNEQHMLEDSMRAFLNIYQARGIVQKIIYFGSGAEFDKSQEISFVKEEDIAKSIPKDAYGFAKYIMNELARQSENVYNLRLFGCYGKGDHESKFITHAIRSCLRGVPITIRQDCVFDYFHVLDLADIIHQILEQKPNYQDYNVCSSVPIKLSRIAQIVKELMGVYDLPIQIQKGGMNKEYTASNERLKRFMGAEWKPLALEDGIKRQIVYERGGDGA